MPSASPANELATTLPALIQEEVRSPEQARRPVCLVLSVGGEAGLSHIGVIRALREKQVPIDCVVGTSMGAMVGGLYAARPNVDVVYSYRKIAQRYRTKAEEEAGTKAVLGALFLGGVAALSGGSGALVAAGTVGGGVAGASAVPRKEWKRLSTVLGDELGEATIESLPIRFGTVHQLLSESGGQAVNVQGGLLVDEMARSIANPLIFTDLKAETGMAIDPGLDRVAAVPVEAACEMFPGHQLVVSNVTSEGIFSSASMKCPYQEVRIPDIHVDPVRAMSAEEPWLSRLADVGYRTASQTLDWSKLPDATHPPRAALQSGGPIWSVPVTLAVEMARTKPSGEAWDLLPGPLPDIYYQTTVSVCEGCDGHGTSANRHGITGLQDNTLRATWDIGVLQLKKDMTLSVELLDKDQWGQHDPVGTFHFTFERPGAVATSRNASATVTVTFGDALNRN